MAARKKAAITAPAPQAYSHPEATSPARPEVGVQAHFKNTQAPAKYRYYSSLAHEFVWDEENTVRGHSEKLIADLLKNMRSSHVFSVCGLPDVIASNAKPGPDKARRWQVERLGLETFDPSTVEADSVSDKEMPVWLLDADYNSMVYKVHQGFFARTGAWEELKMNLKVEFEVGAWDHLAGGTSAPCEPGGQRRIAVKVIDPRGNELLAVKKLEVTK